MSNKLFYVGLAVMLVVFVFISASLQDSKEGGEEGAEALSTQPVATGDISRRANDVPPPIRRTQNKKVVVDLKAQQLVAELAEGVTYEYWTFNGQVPGPFLRVMEGDTVEVQLTHAHDDVALNETVHSFAVTAFMPLAQAADEHDHEAEEGEGHEDHEDMTEEEHAAAGHGEHSIDLHAVLGPGGGAEVMRAAPEETKIFQFKATRPGIYVYHCGSPHVPTHIANGMYGMVLVEPRGGLPAVDREYYVMQGDMYTTGAFGEEGHQGFSLKKMLDESPEYFVFNGRVGALTEDRALKADVGETVRIFFGVATHIPSNFHIIGGIFDRLYSQGDLLSPPKQNIQTTLVPAGSATMIEMRMEYPGTFLLVDHSLTRAIDKGAAGHLVVSGAKQPDIYKAIQ